MLTVIAIATAIAIVILFALMAWQPAITPADTGESAPQDGIDGWDAARTSTVTAATFGIGSLAARVITTHDERVYDLYGKHENRRRNTMDKRQYIAECLDPMDTVAEWQNGEEFADAILESADGELLVTRDDLIEYWQDAREQADSSDPRAITITTNVNQEFTAFGLEWCVDEEGDLMVILDNGRSYVVDYVMEPTWSAWQDADTIEEFTVTITPEHVTRAEEMRAEVTGED